MVFIKKHITHNFRPSLTKGLPKILFIHLPVLCCDVILLKFGNLLYSNTCIK